MDGAHPSAEDSRTEARILVVDDEDANVKALRRLLLRAGYEDVWALSDSQDAVAWYEWTKPDLVLLDLHMPGLDGFDILNLLRTRIAPDEYVPVLVLTGDLDESVKLRALAAGAKDFLTKPFEATEVLLRIGNLVDARQLHQRLRNQNEHLESRVRERTADLVRAKRQIVARLALAAEFRDDQTGEHAVRVGELSALIAHEMGCPEDEVELLREAATLHDIGKIGIPDSILLKPDSLTEGEFAIMKNHVKIGARLLSGGDFPLLAMAEEIAATHHERWDGRGYEGLVGEDIPLVGRIVAVADAFDVLTSDRPYKTAVSKRVAVDRIRMDAGKHFDPAVVEAFLQVAATLDDRSGTDSGYLNYADAAEPISAVAR